MTQFRGHLSFAFPCELWPNSMEWYEYKSTPDPNNLTNLELDVELDSTTQWITTREAAKPTNPLDYDTQARTLD